MDFRGGEASHLFELAVKDMRRIMYKVCVTEKAGSYFILFLD